jgi:hypothetical protein
MTANADKTQQNDGQKQADICPWAASMPLRAEATDEQISARQMHVYFMVNDQEAVKTHAAVAREYAEARVRATQTPEITEDSLMARLTGIEIKYSRALPVGALYAHPDTLKPPAALTAALHGEAR